MKKVWQGIKEIINIKSRNYNIPNCLEVNDELITDILRISDNFNDYFSNVAENILKSSKHKIGKTFDKYLSTPLNNYFVFAPCDPGEVLYLINQLIVTKATGPNGIPTKILQMIGNIVCTPLSKIYNICVRRVSSKQT